MKSVARLPRAVGLTLAFVLASVAPHLGRADAPPGLYAIVNAAVTDTKTKLTWQQTAASAKYAWSDANTYCSTLALNGGGWRLPSENELQTLVDESRANPAIDMVAFPATPAEFFWTSSTVPSFSNFAWAVTFDQGLTTLLDTTATEWARCVR